MSLVQRPKDFDVVLTENNVWRYSFRSSRGVWVRWDCWHRRASAAQSACTSLSMAQHPTSPARELRILWARFLRLRCSCAIRFQLEREAACIENAVGTVLDAVLDRGPGPLWTKFNYNREMEERWSKR